MDDIKLNIKSLLELSKTQLKHSPFYIGTTSNNIIDIIKKTLDLTKYIIPKRKNLLQTIVFYRPKVGLGFTLLGYLSQITAKKYQPKLDNQNKWRSITIIFLFGILAVASFIIGTLMPIVAVLISAITALIILKINCTSLINSLNNFNEMSKYKPRSDNDSSNEFKLKLLIINKQKIQRQQLTLLITQYNLYPQEKNEILAKQILSVLNKMHGNHQLINNKTIPSKQEINLAKNKLITLAISMAIDLSNLILIVGCFLCFSSISLSLTSLLITKCILDLSEFSNNIFNYYNNEKFVTFKNEQKTKQSKLYMSQVNSTINFFKPTSKTASILELGSDNIKTPCII